MLKLGASVSTVLSEGCPTYPSEAHPCAKHRDMYRPYKYTRVTRILFPPPMFEIFSVFLDPPGPNISTVYDLYLRLRSLEQAKSAKGGFGSRV